MARSIHSDVDLGAIVERQMRNWELARQQKPRAEPQREVPAVQTYVAVTRDVACRSERIARMVADRLGWQYFDKELLDYIAGRQETSRRLLESLDEYSISWIEDVLKGIWAQSSSELGYFRALNRAMLALCQHCNLVVVGRGACLILPPESGLRVRLVAPREFRIRTLCHDEGCSEKQAVARLEAREEERALYLAKHHGRNPYDPRRYDLVINTSQYTIENCSTLIIEALRLKTGVG